MSGRRVLFFGLLAALLGAAIVVGPGRDPSRSVPAPLDPTAVRTGIGGSTAWFCPGLPPSVDADGARVTVTNLGRAPADLVVTVLSDRGRAVRRSAAVGPAATRTLRRSNLGPPGSLVVESISAAHRQVFGSQPKVGGVNFYSDAAHMNRYDIPTVNYGLSGRLRTGGEGFDPAEGTPKKAAGPVRAEIRRLLNA